MKLVMDCICAEVDNHYVYFPLCSFKMVPCNVVTGNVVDASISVSIPAIEPVFQKKFRVTIESMDEGLTQ